LSIGAFHGLAGGNWIRRHQVLACRPVPQSILTETPYFMSTATTTSTDTGQQTSPRGLQREAQQPVTQTTPNAANRLRAKMAAVKLSFTWLGVRKTLAQEQRTITARAFHADRELLSASKLILDTKNLATVPWLPFALKHRATGAL
jgi:hypothetical protein